MFAEIMANVEHATIGPVWARLPGTGQRLEGISRGELYCLIREGKIRSKVLAKPGRERGIRLINIASVRAYIENEGVDAPTTPEAA